MPRIERRGNTLVVDGGRQLKGLERTLAEERERIEEAFRKRERELWTQMREHALKVSIPAVQRGYVNDPDLIRRITRAYNGIEELSLSAKEIIDLADPLTRGRWEEVKYLMKAAGVEIWGPWDLEEKEEE
jgi:hypothetical protein